MSRRIRYRWYRWDRVSCPKCGEFGTMKEISYAYLPRREDYFYVYKGSKRPKIPSFPAKSIEGDREPEVGCIECNWQGSKATLRILWIEFQGDNPLRDAEYNITELGDGVRARYQRTLFNTFTHDWGGTAGYRYGVDFHTQIHCELCCCAATENFGCKSPVAGNFTISVGGGGTEWEEWCIATARFHLRDQRRHIRLKPKCQPHLLT